MATTRKRGSHYNVQIRKEGYPSVTKTCTRISVAKQWASSIKEDICLLNSAFTRCVYEKHPTHLVIPFLSHDARP